MAYQTSKDLTSSVGSIFLPSGPIAFSILKAARMDPTVNQTDARAIACPGLLDGLEHTITQNERSANHYSPYTTSESKCYTWILDGGVKLTVFEKSFGLEFKRIGVHILVVEHGPIPRY